ncbi:MAG: asparagine synthase (glutamine-hydrolyzing) [Nitrospira sp.]|nr:MAG: asparagine synthase (glutamine-hydrolyzing) [Nitrospira sp.]
MCGIAGMVGPGASEAVRRMTGSLVHRGPDDGGHYDAPAARLCLGMRRLSILDLAHGHQPMANQDESVWIVYNGEVFNSPELRGRLERDGRRFATANSDTETLLHLYDEKQEAMLADLNGMFAFVLHDKRRRLLFGARDRLGIKPLYYALTPSGFAFASELKGLLTAPGIRRELNRDSLSHYVTLRFVPGTASIVRGVARLAPGHWFRYDLTSGAFETQCYWRPSFAPQEGRSVQEWSEQVRTDLRAAVRRWSLSDVAIGCSLSGGLDSSSIVGLLADSGHRRLKTYSLGFVGEGAAALDELPLARQVAERWGTDHHELILRPEDLLRDLLKMVWALDEPYGGGLPSWYVFQFMQQDVKVGMTGSGGDELFGDYGRYIALERRLGEGRDTSCPSWMERGWPLVASFVDRLPHGLGGLRRKDRWRHYPLVRRDPFGWDYVQAFYYCSEPMKSRDVLLPAEDGRPIADTVECLRTYYQESGSAEPRDALTYVALRTQLPEEFLFMTDRFSMAHSLEARVPFLDHLFVESVLRIPAHIRTKPEDPKYLLRQALRDLLPDDLVHAPKRGFVIPTAQWLRGPLRPLAERMLNPARLAEQGLFRPEFHARFVRPHVEGQADYHPQVWTALMFQLWHSLYVEQQLTEAPSMTWQDLCA